MKILITGGFGYLGGRLDRHLAADGATVVLGSRRAAPAPPWLSDATTAITDWSSVAALTEICRGMDAVVHAAGMNAADCARDPAEALAANGVATARLVQAAIAAGVPRLLYVSTAHVYASPLAGSVTEATCPSNLHPYATSHRAGEDAVRAAHAKGEIAGVVIRLSNAVGPPTHAAADCWMLLVNDLARQVARTGRLVLQSAGTQRRDFVALGEACRIVAALLALPRDRLGDGLFNLGGGRSWTVLEMAELVAARWAAVHGGAPPSVERPAGRLGPSEDLDYNVSRIEKAGISRPRPELVGAEIDALIRFCNAEAS